MSGKVIWIINHYAGSPLHGMEYRHYYLAQQFVRMGLKPVIIGASFHHLLTRYPEGTAGEVDGIPYVWIKTCRYRGNSIGRVFNMVEFSARLALRRLGKVTRPDVIIASSPHPFVAFNGHRLARRHRAKFIFEVRDLWPLTLQELGGYSARHPLIRAMARAERLGYEACDYTVSLLGGAKDLMAAHGLDERKFVHIPNGIDPETWQNVQELPGEHARVIQTLKEQGRRIVLYSGSHGPGNALDNLVEAAGLVADERSIHFLLVGQGSEKENLQQQAQQAELRNITFLPPVAKSQMPALMRAADLGYIGLPRKDLFQYGVSPNKLFEYMSAGLPVLFAIDTAFDEVAQAQCGFSVPAEDARALAAVLREIPPMSADGLGRMGEQGRQYVQRTHSYKMLARQYAQLF